MHKVKNRTQKTKCSLLVKKHGGKQEAGGFTVCHDADKRSAVTNELNNIVKLGH